MNKFIIISLLALSLISVTGFKYLHTAVATHAAAQQAPQRSGPTREARILGFLDEQFPDTIVVPSAVSVGEDFQVTVITSGSGCEREADTGVIVTENGANVMVYDFTAATHPGVVCLAVLKRLPHTVTLRFTKPGEAVIRVWGRRGGATIPPMGEPTVLERRVMVN
jgi:hypothetical protein